MNRFDKLNLELDINTFQYIDYSQFNTLIDKEGVVTLWSYQQKIPYHLKVVINPIKNKVYIDFTGKILCDFYPELISRHTIDEVICNLNGEKLFYIEPEDLIEFADVRACDVTVDIDTLTTVEDLYKNLVLKNTKKYIIKSLNQSRTSFTITNNVADPRYKESLLIYDKENEIKESNNRPFLDFVPASSELLEYFNNKKRLELNLHSVNRIRKYFDISSKEKPKLYMLLDYHQDILIKFLKEIITPVNPIEILKSALLGDNYKMKVMLQLLFLCLCDFNQFTVEKTVREMHDKTTGISRIMEPYHRLMNEINHVSNGETNELKEFKEFITKLKEMVINCLKVDETTSGQNILLELYKDHLGKEDSLSK